MSVSPLNLSEIPLDGKENISSKTPVLNSSNVGSFVLVPSSMLKFLFSSDLKILQNNCSESQSNFIQSASPSSETTLNTNANARRRCAIRDVTKRKNIPQNESSKLSIVEKSNNEKYDCGEARKEKMNKTKRNANKITRNHFRQMQHKKEGNVFNPKCDSMKSTSRNDDSKFCLICGEISGKHLYYGGQSCQSCKAFFRRSVQTVKRLILVFYLL